MKKQRFYNLFLFAGMLCMLLSACKKERIEDEVTRKKSDETEKTVLDDNYIYRLPVIFHVITKGSYSTQNTVPASRYATLLNHVNELYRGGIYGASNDIKVEFYPAPTDEAGNRLPVAGVENIRWNGNYPIDVEEFMTDSRGTNVKYLWDPNRYINVMVFAFDQEDDDGVILGISHLPYKAAGNATLQGLERALYNNMTKANLTHAQCLAINLNYIEEPAGRYVSATHQQSLFSYKSDDAVVTLAHELGHYLGLYHVFTESRTGGMIDACGDSDYCLDTPSYNKKAYDRILTGYIGKLTREDLPKLFLRTDCKGNEFQSVNIMDYAYCHAYQFSADQKYRMRQVLYYSPLIPGPKKAIQGTRSIAPERPLNLPVRIAHEPKHH